MPLIQKLLLSLRPSIAVNWLFPWLYRKDVQIGNRGWFTVSKYAGNPILSPIGVGWESVLVMSPSIIIKDGTYHMMYRGSDGVNSRIGHATSSDGINWNRDPANPVIDIGGAGQPDSVGCEDPTIVYEGGTYYIFYIGYDGVDSQGMLATTTDFVTFTKQGLILPKGAGGSYDDSFAKPLGFVKIGAGWIMYYECKRAGANPTNTAVATASNLAGPWTKQGLIFTSTEFIDTTNPTFGVGDALLYNRGVFLAGGSAGNLPFSHANPYWGHALFLSKGDPEHTRFGETVGFRPRPIGFQEVFIDVGGAGAWDDAIVYPSCLMYDTIAGEYRLYYGGNDHAIGLAILTEAGASARTDYPVIIILSAHNFDFDDAQVNGQDIRFTLDDGVTLLDHYIDTWDKPNEKALIFVKVPTVLASADTKIYMYYGNAVAPDVSDELKVFPAKDEFNDGAFDPKWSWYNTPTYDEGVTRANWLYVDTNCVGAPDSANLTTCCYMRQSFEGDFEIETEVDGSLLNDDWEQMAIVGEQADGTYVSLCFVYINALDFYIYLNSVINNVRTYVESGAVRPIGDVCKIKLIKRGPRIWAYYDLNDGVGWREIDNGLNHNVATEINHIGLAYSNIGSASNAHFYVNYFRVRRYQDPPPVAEVVV